MQGLSVGISSGTRDFCAEVDEPELCLTAMTAGAEVVADYRHIGLSLKAHPVSFLRDELKKVGIVSCADAMRAKDGRWVEVAGLVLVRQRPGSGKGVMFVTVEDESGVVNVVVWPSVFEKQRRVLLGSAMMGIKGRIQREGEVVHLVANFLTDLSASLASIGSREDGFRLPHNRGTVA